MNLNTVITQGTRDIWYLKSWREAGRPGLDVGNFTAITLFADPKGVTGGQTNWVWLDVREVAWIKSINVNSYRLWNWACQPDGKIYLTNENDNPYQTITVRWPRIALGSPDDVDVSRRNQVRVLEWVGNYVRIDSIAEGMDYSKVTAPWLIQTAYTVFPDGHSGSNPLYKMPLFDPASGYKVSLGERGLWLDTKWLHSRAG